MDKLVSALHTHFDGINTNYLCSLSDEELNHLLNYLTQEEIDPSLFLYLSVARTESMDSDEKQYWLDIGPSMTTEQMRRLICILCTEKRKLERIEIQYSKEIKYMNLLLEIAGDGNGNLRDDWQNVMGEVSEIIKDDDENLVENWATIMANLSDNLRPDGKLRDDWESEIKKFKESQLLVQDEETLKPTT